MPKGEYVRTNKKTSVKKWERGDEIPALLDVSDFMTGIGVEPETLAQIQKKAGVQPLYARAPGQTKGYPSRTVFTKEQVEQLLGIWDTMHAPAPPTMEQQLALDVKAMRGSVSDFNITADTIKRSIDGLSDKIDQGFLSIRTLIAQMQETHTEPTFQPPLQDDKNTDANTPEPARPILRRRH